MRRTLALALVVTALLLAAASALSTARTDTPAPATRDAAATDPSAQALEQLASWPLAMP